MNLSVLSTEMQHLEWNVLHKVQERVWGLPTVVQRSQEDHCPSAPNHSPKPCATKAQDVISVPPRPMLLSLSLMHSLLSVTRFRKKKKKKKKLECHLRKRLIQHWWGLPCRIYESLAGMSSPSTLPQLPESQGHRGRSGNSNKCEIKLSVSKSVYAEDPEMLQLEHRDLAKYKDDPEQDNNDLEKDKNLEKENDDWKGDQGRNPGNGPKDYLLSDPVSSSDNEMGYDSEKELRSPSVKTSRVSAETMGERQLENALKIHLSRKLEEINEGQLPGTVHNSWYTMKQTSPLSEKFARLE